MGIIKALVMADSHLGFDYPFKPRIKRRRRGEDFFANFDRILDHTRSEAIDLIVHGGDIFYRSKIPGRLVEMVFNRLHAVADSGIPVYMVPGNHERSAIPYRLLAEHPNIHFFDHPTAYVFKKKGIRICLAGFPSERHHIREKFSTLLDKTGWQAKNADFTLLCLHQSIDGAVTGPHNFTFRYHSDVINIREIPAAFAAVITGHMHRYQVITQDLSGKRVAPLIVYPGSIERTSFAEKDEDKGFVTLHIDSETDQVMQHFHQLPARPMIDLHYDEAEDFRRWLKKRISEVDADSILRVHLNESENGKYRPGLNAAALRALIPETMNIQIHMPGNRRAV